ncbi:HNH endonuclease [Halobacillus massiliensis]|uniref:HNH endonuclease n=1 Tax=Halobacillus massiliensis TaxID=1926286 RepID=UPI0015C4445C|nr:HNH endonuclease [Halobacillus massiliensis]
MEYKVCSHCKRSMPKTKEFFVSDGERIKSPCKECNKKRNHERYIKNRSERKRKAKIYREMKQAEKEQEKKMAELKMKSTNEWKDIEYNNEYMVSLRGEIYSKFHRRNLVPGTKENGYKSIPLWVDNTGKNYYVHRLVMEHFSEEEPKETVNHIDGDKANNHISNLEWATYIENNVHAKETGLWSIPKNNPKTSTRVKQFDLEGNFIKEYPSMRQAQRETGADCTGIGHSIRKGRQCGGFIWKLA